MPAPVPVRTEPVQDTVPKVNNEVAVGSDLKFQYHWWRFERTIWIFFALLIAADIAGVFGRGPLANAHARTKDGTLDVKYEHVERFGTPSILSIKFGPNTLHDGKILLWVSNSLVNQLGNQRVIPQPETSTVGPHGYVYSFPATQTPASASFALEPSSPGIFYIEMRSAGAETLKLKIWVVP